MELEWCAPVALFGVARAGRDPWGTAGSLSRAIVYTLVPIRPRQSRDAPSRETRLVGQAATTSTTTQVRLSD